MVVAEWAILEVEAVDIQVVLVVPITHNIREVEAEVHTMQDPTKITVLQRTQDTEKSLLGYWVK